MLSHDLRCALRNLKRQKAGAVINGIGLAVGLAFFILLASYVRDETTYDRFHPRADKIYLVTNEFRGSFYGGSAHFLAGMLQSDYPEVRDVARASFLSCPVRSSTDLVDRTVGFADPEFLKMFRFPLLLGDSGHILDDPGRIVLSLNMARIYFGEDDPLGKKLTIRLGNAYKDFLVAGVLDRVPGNSSLRFDVLMNYRNMFPAFGIDEVNVDLVRLPLATATFIILDGESQADSLRAKLPALQRKIFGELFEKAGIELPKYGMGLIKFQDYHLGDVAAPFLAPRNKASSSAILAGIALAVLLLACFNYMNLALGHSAARFKEIAVRKTIGSGQAGLIRLFLTESILQSLLASVLGLVLAVLFLPAFNSFTGKSLSLRDFGNGWTAVFLAVLVLFTGLAAGGYPAFFLSRRSIVDIFGGRSTLGRKSVFSRFILILQFAASLVFIFGTIVMAAQLRFLSSKDLGFDRNGVVVVETQLPMGAGQAGRDMLNFFKTELRSRPGIVAVAGDSGLMGDGLGSFGHPFVRDGRKIDVQAYLIDEDYLTAMGLALAQGRNFSPEFGADSTSAALVNETLVRRFGIPDPVGKRFSEFAADNSPKGFKYDPMIIGVVKDFHIDSLHSEIEPSAFTLFDQAIQRYRRILVRIDGRDIPESLAQIKRTWEKVSPDRPFSYEFLDDALDRQYGKERNWSRILNYSAGAAILIASLGLFGMAALAAARRTKEIGIRKVLGASTRRIILTMSREFIVLLGLAHLFAWPAAYYVGRLWLRGFPFNTGLRPWMFILSSVTIVIVSLVTLSGQAFRATRIDPVKALRSE